MLAHKDFCPHLELKELLPYCRTNKIKQKRFRSLFSDYYGFNNYKRFIQKSLRRKFEDAFYKILFRGNIFEDGKPAFCKIFSELSKYKSKKAKYALHFSFISKMIAMHYENSPIYDSHVRAFFKKEPSHLNGRDIDRRIEKFIEFLNGVRADYEKWVENARISKVIQNLKKRDVRLKNYDQVRLLDFLVWKSEQKN